MNEREKPAARIRSIFKRRLQGRRIVINRSMYRTLVEERDQSLWEQTTDEQAIRLLKEQIEALEWYALPFSS